MEHEMIMLATGATAAIIASTIVAAAGIGVSYAQSEKARSQQEKALQQQQQAQKKAAEQAQMQQRRSETAMNAANRRTPDTASIMERAGEMGAGGASSTMLTGPTGVDMGANALGRNTLLGG